MHMDMKSRIYKYHYCSSEAKVSFTREGAVKDNSVIFSSVSSLKIRINIIKNPKSCTIYEYSHVLKIWDFEILKCSWFSDFEHLAAKLRSFETKKLFEITLWYDCGKMFIEKGVSQMSLFNSCKYWFMFKIILICFVIRNKRQNGVSFNNCNYSTAMQRY